MEDTEKNQEVQEDPSPKGLGGASRLEDGGPAFPVMEFHEEWSHDQGKYIEKVYATGGMSLRDYFMTRAPINQQWHFEVKMPAPRPEDDWTGRDKNNPDEMPANWKEQSAWDEERRRQAFIQWPWVWADTMLQARKAGEK